MQFEHVLKSIEKKVKHTEEIISLYNQIELETNELKTFAESSILDKDRREKVNKMFEDLMGSIKTVYIIITLFTNR